jgi:hypothetical protein
MKPVESARRGRLSAAPWCGVLLVALASRIFAAEAKPPERHEAFARLTPNGQPGQFDFETPQIEGTFRLDGPYHGVSRLVDKRTGRQVIDARYSALNLFKLMSVNLKMDEPRTMERTMRANAEWAEIVWAPTAAHRAEVVARYEVAAPNAVELTLTVRSRGVYAGYEVFLTNYFDKRLVPHVYLSPNRAVDAVKPVVPLVSDVIRGTLPVFARDALAARRCVDGRWERNERGASIVQMCPVRHYFYCLAVMADPESDLGIVLMAHPQDCYAISARYHAADEADRLTPYSAFDLSLFGDDFAPGDARTVKVRLAMTPLDEHQSQAVALYKSFIGERAASLNSDHPKKVRQHDGS